MDTLLFNNYNFKFFVACYPTKTIYTIKRSVDKINFECGYFQFKVLTWMNIIEDFMKRNDPTRDAWVSTISHRQIQECCCLPISDKLNIIDFIFSHIIWAVDFQINIREQEMFVFSSSSPLKLIDISWMIMIWYCISTM